MMLVIKNIKKKIYVLKETGFFYMVISEMLSQMVTFMGGIVLIRVLTKTDYGFYSYVNNATIILFILGDLGASYAYFQFANENVRDSSKVSLFWKFGVVMCIGGGVIAALISVFSPLFYPYVIKGASDIVAMMCLLTLIVNMNALMKANLRVYSQNKKYAIQNFAYTLESYILLLVGGYFWGARGALLSKYVCELFIFLWLLYLNRNILHWTSNVSVLGGDEKKSFITYAVSMKCNDIITKVMTIIDVFMISFVFKDSEIIASYKVAAIIPTALVFVPNSIMLYSMSYLVKNNDKIDWIKRRTTWIISSLLAVCGLIAVVGIITANWFLPLVFGGNYSDSSKCYQILLINFVFHGGVMIPLANIMSALKIVIPKSVVLIIGSIMNIILDIILIDKMGSIGAAVATLTITVFSTILYYIIINKRFIREDY